MKLFSLMLIAMLTCSSLMAKNFSSNNIQLLHGNKYKIGREKREVISINHFTSASKGELAYFFDVTHPSEDNTAIYGELIGALSSQKFFNLDIKKSFIKDYLLAGSFEFGNATRTYLIGPSLQFNMPFFDVFKLFFYWRDEPRRDGHAYQLTWVWKKLMEFNNIRLSFEGVADFATNEGSTKRAWVFATPQLLLDVGNFFNSPNVFWTGFEFQYAPNKFGQKDSDEAVTQAMLKYQF